jgi:hypothetical protein
MQDLKNKCVCIDRFRNLRDKMFTNFSQIDAKSKIG